MKISIFGLGYVGTVSAGCLANDGHEVIGVDPVQTKVDLINNGQSPIIEADIGEIIAAAVAGRPAARHRRSSPKRSARRNCPSSASAHRARRMAISTCGTSGESASRSVRRSKTKHARHTVVIRSTILPGTMRKIVIPALEEFSGKKAGVDFGVCNNPEFLREGSAVKDFHCSAQDRDRRVGSSQRRYAGVALRKTRRATDSDGSGNRGDGQVRRQQLACAQDRLCQ